MDPISRVMKFAAMVLVAVAACGVVALVVYNSWASVRLERQLRPLRAAGHPLALADLSRQPIPPEINAAEYLRSANRDLKAIESVVTTAVEAQPQADQDTFYQMQDGRVSPGIMEAIRSALAAHPDFYPLLLQASRCPEYDPQINYNVAATAIDNELSLGLSRSAIRCLRYRTLVLLDEGRNEEAFDTALVMLRLCRHFDGNPMIVGYLVSLATRDASIDAANRVLRAGPLPDAAYQRLDDELAQHDVVAGYRQALITERACGVQSFQELIDARFAMRLYPATFNHDQADYLELIEVLIAGAGQPYADSVAVHQVGTMVSGSGALTGLFAPAAQATFDAKCRVQTELRCLRILNAMLRREQAGQEIGPKLEELGLPAEALEDPYSGESLLVKRLPAGWVVYSVGKKLADGGGTNLGSEYEQDVGVGPVTIGKATSGESE